MKKSEFKKVAVGSKLVDKKGQEFVVTSINLNETKDGQYVWDLNYNSVELALQYKTENTVTIRLKLDNTKTIRLSTLSSYELI